MSTMWERIDFHTYLRYAEAGVQHRAHVYKPSVILLHGLCEKLEIWNSMAQSLARDYHVVAIDLRGHTPMKLMNDTRKKGVATHDVEPIPNVPDAPWSIPDFADDIFSVMDMLGIARGVVVGHSLGGYVAMAMAKHAPERLAGLSLFYSTPFADTEQARENRLRMITMIEDGHIDKVLEMLLLRVLPDDVRKEKPHLVAELRAMLEEQSPDYLVRTLSAMREREDTTEVLARLSCPILFVLGGRDPIIPFEMMKPLLDRPAHTLVHYMRDVAHQGMMEAPTETTIAVRALVELAVQHEPT